MRVVVCVKQVVDTTMPVRLDIVTNRLPEKLSYITNPADENACEEAIRLKDKYGAKVILLTAGPPRAETTLRHCLAMGGNRAVRIWHPSLEDGGAYVTAQLLVQAIRPLKPDLILCGSQSLDEGTGQTPPLIAELLDLPQVTRTTTLQVFPSENRLIAQRRLEKGHRQVIECRLPALVSVETSINRPRYPAFRAIRRAQSEPISTIGEESFGAIDLDSPARFIKLSPPRPRPKKTMLMDTNLSPEERLKQIMSGGITEKASSTWEGSPEDLAARLIQALEQFIRPGD